MTSYGRHRTVHETEIDAPADTVYAIIADATAWPERFTPTVHVEREPLGAAAERLRIWATANGEVKHWTSRRDLDAAARRVRFRQEVCSPPVAAMGGEWVVEERPGDATRLVLHHDFEAVDDHADQVAWIGTATDRNSRTELANIKALAEGWEDRSELVFSFSDSELIDGPADVAYDFLQQAAKWPDRLPHVSRMELTEPAPNVQAMTMVTRAGNGSEHTTESVRVCFPADRIVYKQLVTPPLMTTHTGVWRLEKTAGGIKVTSHHTIALNASAIPAVLGEEATPASARAYVRAAVGGNSAATLAHAKRFTESAHAR
ncbi:aromatase/cyclase [Streptomyces varsoviensis]|uniref:aromatase/cyclase n=1 Tax=Streptomyces varsoviensis TaxID=67373 RepID=UPI0033EA3983